MTHMAALFNRLRRGVGRLSSRRGFRTRGRDGDRESGREEKESLTLTGDAREDARRVRKVFGEPPDLVTRAVPGRGRQKAVVVYIDGLVSQDQVAEHIIAPLQRGWKRGDWPAPFPAGVSRLDDMDGVVGALTRGQCVVFFDGEAPSAYDVRQWAMRGVEQVQTEPTEGGPQEGFIEDLSANLVLLRRRLRTHRLRSESFTLGAWSRTEVLLVYLDGIAREELVEEVRRRLRRLNIDAVLGTNYVDELTSDNPLSPFPSTLTTERPDRVVAMLLEGNVALLIDGSPLALVMPGTFSGLLQSSDDFHRRFYNASFARMLRWGAAVIGLLAPSIYISLISYHHELIPTRLLFTIAVGREGVPFPPVVEAILMELAFELLREAGLRMPRQFGQALSIVGVLVIGDAAVRAGLVSPLMIVVVGMTAIATFAIPSTELANGIRLLRFPMMALAGMLGLFGVFFGFMLVIALLIISRSYGVPYLTPIIPVWFHGLRDTSFRAPLWLHTERPWYVVQPEQTRRQRPELHRRKAGPPPGERP